MLIVSIEAPVVELDLTVRNGVMIRAGEPLILPALVTGKPPPDIKWTKDDGPPDKDHVEIENVGKESILSIKAATRKDPGKYQISARNSSGIKSTWTRVDVMGKCFDEFSISYDITVCHFGHISHLVVL